MICNKCNGLGFIETKNYETNGTTYTCPKCNGSKDLDWIEMIVGKKERLLKAAWTFSPPYNNDNEKKIKNVLYNDLYGDYE